ncbi:MAG: glycosyltransferase family 9 protein [bacterium]
MKKADLAEVKKILVIRPGAIGDVLLTTPFIRALKKALPGAVIDYAVRPFAAHVLEGNPGINSIKFIEKKGFFPDLKFYREIAREKYDLVFDLFGNLRTALIAFFSGARYKTGFNFRFRKYFYNIKVAPHPKARYNVYFHMQLLDALGIKQDGPDTEIFIREKDEKKSREFIGRLKAEYTGPVVGLNPAGTWYTKKWPEKSYARLGDMVLEKYPDASVVVLWGPGEKETALNIAAYAEKKESFFPAPETSLREMAAIIRDLDVLVTNDGAGKHLAAAVRTPAVTIYGPTDHISWNPEDEDRYPVVISREPCAPCDKVACGNFICMQGIEPREVMEKTENILKQEVLYAGD